MIADPPYPSTSYDNIVQTWPEFETALKELQNAKTLYFDTETSGLRYWKGDRVCGVGIGVSPEKVWYFPFRHIGDFADPKENLPIGWLSYLADLLSKAPVLVGYNLKFDLTMMHFEGYIPNSDQKLIDVKVMARLCVPEKHPPGGLTLQTMSERFIGSGSGTYNDKLKVWMAANKLWVESKKIRLFNHVPVEQLGPYCIQDTICTMKLRKIFQQKIIQTAQQKVWVTEVNTTRTLYEMEIKGVRIDLVYCELAIATLNDRLEAIKEEMIVLTGSWFNPNSGKQISEAMNAIGIFSPILSEKTKDQSWGKDALAALGGKHAPPAVKLIREYKQLLSLKNTFFQVFLDTGGDLHGTFNNAGAITGRCSSSDPNLQNIPALIQKMEEEGEEFDLHQSVLTALGIDASRFMAVTVAHDADSYDEDDNAAVAARRAIVPRPGYVFLRADYSQMEMLAFLCYINNQVLMKEISESYKNYEHFDFHDMVAYQVWGVTKDSDDYKIYRKMAKGINFGLIFGIGTKKLAKTLGVTIEQAQAYKDEYFAKIEGAEVFIDRVQQTVQARGYISNFFGRRYTLSHQDAYKGVNYLDQGSCADFMKERMWKLRCGLLDHELDAYLVLQVHDELVVECREDQVMQVATMMKQIMEEKVFAIQFPVTVEVCRESWIKGETIDAKELDQLAGVAV